MKVLGLKITSHDTGAALITEQGIVAIAEERLCRIKHSRGIFPALSINYCLQALHVKPEEVDLIVIDQIGHSSVVKMREIFSQWDNDRRFAAARLEVINHHEAHAASAFFCSPFKEAAILIYDGSGEQFTTRFGINTDETDTYYYGIDNSFVMLAKTTHVRLANRRFPYTFGIAKLYSLLSAAYINFGKYNEGKMMGLAAYGDDRILKRFPRSCWFTEELGQLVCNAQISWPKSLPETSVLLKKMLQPKALLTVTNILKRRLFIAIQRLARYLFLVTHQQDNMLSVDPKLFAPIKLPKPPRPKQLALPDDYYASVAYAAQHLLEGFAVASGNKLRQLTNTDNICIAGGAGLNIDTNKHFINKVGFKHIFIQPAATDTGIPLGCALYGWHTLAKKPRSWEMKSASLGRRYAEEEIIEALAKQAEKIQFKKTNQVCQETARLIADGKIIGWFAGGSEYGPRALGNRSILCDATRPEMKDILNDRVKHREPWRPFAASVLAELVTDWFDLSIPSPFMLFEGPVREDKKSRIPAVLHIDGTTRIQAVSPESNQRYYELIQTFYALTGVPLVLNTSFNLAGDPIVETPADALDTFLRTQMDYLVLEDYIVSKANK